jgi:hypothetical protein
MKKESLYLIILLIFSSCSTNKLEDLKATGPTTDLERNNKVYKEFTIDGQKIFKWVTLKEEKEYDQNGNLIRHKKQHIHSQTEVIFEYDSNNNLIHEKQIPVVKTGMNMMIKTI